MDRSRTIFKVMVKELPAYIKDGQKADYYIDIMEEGYESTMQPDGAIYGTYEYNPITGIYSLSDGTTLRVNTRGYTYTDACKRVRMVDYVGARTVVAQLNGAASVVIPGGYKMDITFTLDMFSDEKCTLTQSVSKTVFNGNWRKDEDSNYRIYLEHVNVCDCISNGGAIQATLQGNLGGIHFSTVMSGQEVGS